MISLSLAIISYTFVQIHMFSLWQTKRGSSVFEIPFCIDLVDRCLQIYWVVWLIEDILILNCILFYYLLKLMVGGAHLRPFLESRHWFWVIWAPKNLSRHTWKRAVYSTVMRRSRTKLINLLKSKNYFKQIFTRENFLSNALFSNYFTIASM